MITGYRLIKTIAGEIISQYNELPKKVRVDALKLSYHSPDLGILDDTYSLLEEILIDDGGDVFVDETYQTTETQYITTKNYRSFTQEEVTQKDSDKLEQDIKQVKEYAHQDILNDHADWKQRNMIANAIKVLVDLLVSENVLTQEQVDATELNGLKQILIDINARRTLSDQQEQDLINGVKTIEDIHNELYSEQ